MNGDGRADRVAYREVSALDIDPGFTYFQSGRLLEWQCAQCGHDCEYELRSGWLFGLGARSIDGVANEIVVECTCREGHLDSDGAQSTSGGCGCFFKHG